MSAPPGYVYNAARREYVRRPHSSSNPPPPPVPPKELETYGDEYVVSPVKETHHGLDAEMGRLSLESEPAAAAARYSSSSPEPPKKRKVRVLSLDGGGIRGYSTLLILQELMHQVYVHEHDGHAPTSPADLPKPCDYFDLIGGNGTGGLIALMLGRMRMDIESCKAYYVELTRYVFITDKTLMGVPYGKTLFKARRLAEAIKYCVRESTRFDSDKIVPHSPPPAIHSANGAGPQRTNSWGRRSSSSSSHRSRDLPERGRSGYGARRHGNPDAPLLDPREGACKMFVTAMLQGSRKGASPVLLRSYPSPAESSASYRTTIWEAGRATCATAAAFKPITIDQITFLDEGAGRYNPAKEVLEEAHRHEFPDAELAVFVSVGTGKRRPNEAADEGHHWWEGMVSSSLDSFAEARRRLLRRVDDCERVHRELVDGVEGGRPGLAQGGVATQDYYRFNVEVGVGEFGVNEWNRLAEVSTGTRRYLQQRETTHLVRESARKLVDVDRSHVSAGTKVRFRPSSHGAAAAGPTSAPVPTAAELPAERTSPPIVRHAVRPQKSQPALPAAGMPNSPYDRVQRRPRRDSHPPPQPLTSSHGHHRPSASQPAISMPFGPDDIHPAADSPAPIGIMSPPPNNAHPGAMPPPLPRKDKPGVPLFAGGDFDGDTPNPEIRVTSPTTVASDSDPSDEEQYPGYGRRRKLHARRKQKPPYPMEGLME